MACSHVTSISLSAGLSVAPADALLYRCELPYLRY